jgi:uncharacterized damage-inducible protein DinB
MVQQTEVQMFLAVWNAEAARTITLMESLPPDQYNFRPDPQGRSIGELSWHLSEIDACLTFAIQHDRFRYEDEPPNVKRPRETGLLAPGYRRIHEEAVARLATLTDADLDHQVTYFDGSRLSIREVLWDQLLRHLVHHRGQLVLLCRMAGGTPPGLYGPNREQMRALQANASGNAGAP